MANKGEAGVGCGGAGTAVRLLAWRRSTPAAPPGGCRHRRASRSGRASPGRRFVAVRSSRFRSAWRCCLSWGLLTVRYALFTAAITTYAVLLADSIGEAALRAAGQRALATAIGIAISAAAFLLWPNPGEGHKGDSAQSR